MKRNIKFQGNPLTLVGRAIGVGRPAADFRVVSQELKELALRDFQGKTKVITAFPSLDTPVCDLQVREFNKRAAGFSSDVAVIGISKDLPFAQKRFCQDHGVKNATIVSDYRYSSFGINYGLLIKELNLLARAVIIVDKSDAIRYIQIVEELTSPPDYEAALKALEDSGRAGAAAAQGPLLRCRPCKGGVAALSKDKIEELLAERRGWELLENKKLAKDFKFRDFAEAKYFLDIVSAIAEEQEHHPILTINYNKLRITLTTHAAGGLSDNDFIMAGIIDELGAGDKEGLSHYGC
ncbi:MAG: thiol peroxidase [Candidatus Omnitrophota bacterium]